MPEKFQKGDALSLRTASLNLRVKLIIPFLSEDTSFDVRDPPADCAGPAKKQKGIAGNNKENIIIKNQMNFNRYSNT